MVEPDGEVELELRRELPGRLRPWIEWFGAGRLAGAALTIVVAVGVGWWLLRPSAPPTEAVLPYASVPSTPSPSTPTPAADATTTTAPDVVVHVAGAVVAPGVYDLPVGTRVDGAVAAAGGVAADADASAINLAAPLTDGERVYVPRAGEVVPAVAGPSASGSAVPAGPIDVNHASADELDTLPGIGPTTAAAIVGHREENGPFASVEDLEDVAGIGPAKLAAIRDLVTV